MIILKSLKQKSKFFDVVLVKLWALNNNSANCTLLLRIEDSTNNVAYVVRLKSPPSLSREDCQHPYEKFAKGFTINTNYI